MFCNLSKQLSCSALSLGPILVCVPLLMSAGCTTDATEDESTTAQATTVGCTVLRPYGWETAATACSEGPIVPPGTALYLSPGQTARFTTQIETVGLGFGWVDIQCDTSGANHWQETDLSCVPEDVVSF